MSRRGSHRLIARNMAGQVQNSPAAGPREAAGNATIAYARGRLEPSRTLFAEACARYPGGLRWYTSGHILEQFPVLSVTLSTQ